MKCAKFRLIVVNYVQIKAMFACFSCLFDKFYFIFGEFLFNYMSTCRYYFQNCLSVFSKRCFVNSIIINILNSQSIHKVTWSTPVLSQVQMHPLTLRAGVSQGPGLKPIIDKLEGPFWTLAHTQKQSIKFLQYSCIWLHCSIKLHQWECRSNPNLIEQQKPGRVTVTFCYFTLIASQTFIRQSSKTL